MTCPQCGNDDGFTFDGETIICSQCFFFLRASPRRRFWRFVWNTLPERWEARLIRFLIWVAPRQDPVWPQCPGCGNREYFEDDGAHWCLVCHSFFYWDPERGYRWVEYFRSTAWYDGQEYPAWELSW